MLPMPAGLGEAVLVRARSAMGVTVTLAEAVLLAATGSNSLADVLAVFEAPTENWDGVSVMTHK